MKAVFVVDTNVLLHAVNKSSKSHRQARLLLVEWSTGATSFHLTWGIVYEFLRVATHGAVFERPLSFAEAWGFVDALLRRGVRLLVETDAHRGELNERTQDLPELSGSRLHDLHTALLMREHGIAEIKTLDTDFFRFAWVRPTRPWPAEAR